MFYYVHLLSGPQGKKRPVGCVAYDKRHRSEHGEVAFATAMRPSIDSDGERLATDIVCCETKFLRASSTSEFSNSLGHSRQFDDVPVTSANPSIAAV
jgi:hypothetical protein